MQRIGQKRRGTLSDILSEETCEDEEDEDGLDLLEASCSSSPSSSSPRESKFRRKEQEEGLESLGAEREYFYTIQIVAKFKFSINPSFEPFYLCFSPFFWITIRIHLVVENRQT